MGKKWSEPKPEWVEEAEAKLAKYYGESVRPISQYCQAFVDWHTGIQAMLSDQDAGGQEENWEGVNEALNVLQIPIRKSNMLWRLIYLGQQVRTEKCPIHQGHWMGYGECENDPPCNSGWDITGWLPNPDDPEGRSVNAMATIKEGQIAQMEFGPSNKENDGISNDGENKAPRVDRRES
jgi:hypothetical protein